MRTLDESMKVLGAIKGYQEHGIIFARRDDQKALERVERDTERMLESGKKDKTPRLAPKNSTTED